MAQSLRLYGFPFSQPTRSVLLLLKENKIPFDLVHIDARKGDARKPDYKKIVPTGMVPAIEDNGFVLSETGAILTYISNKHHLHKWYPLDLQKRAKVEFWLHWNHTNTRASTKQIIVKKFWPPKDVPLEQTLDQGRKQLAMSVQFIENALTSHQGKYLCPGEHPTIADLFVVPELDQQLPEAMGLFDFTKYPKVLDWMQNLRTTLPSYEEVFQPVVIESEKYRKST